MLLSRVTSRCSMFHQRKVSVLPQIQILLFLTESYLVTALAVLMITCLLYSLVLMSLMSRQPFSDSFHPQTAARSLFILNLLAATVGCKCRAQGNNNSCRRERFCFNSHTPILPAEPENQIVDLWNTRSCISVPSGCHSRVNVKRRERQHPVVPVVNDADTQKTK